MTEVIFKTRPLVCPGNGFFTRTETENTLQDFQGLLYRPGAGKRAKITRAVIFQRTGIRHCRPIFIEVDFDIRVAFVILETDIIIRPISLDEIIFQDEGFIFRIGDEEFQFFGFFYLLYSFRRQFSRRLKIGTYTIAEAARFADVDNFPAGIFHQIDTRVGGQLFQLFVYQVTCHRCLRDINCLK